MTTQVSGTLAVANGGTGVTTSTGTGNTVLSTSPILVTPILGTPTSGTLTNCTGLPTSGLTGNISLTTQVSGTLPVANGGTGVTTSTGTGNTVLSTSPTLVTPILGTPTSGNLSSCTADGTNLVGYRNIPQYPFSSASTYTPSTADVGKHIYLTGTGGATIPSGTFAVGDVVTFVNYTSSSISIVTSAVTAYIAGTNTSASPRTLAQRGICTMLCVSANNFVLTGAGLS